MVEHCIDIAKVTGSSPVLPTSTAHNNEPNGKCMNTLQDTYKNEFDVAKNIAYEAGKIMLQYFDSDVGETIKQDSTPLTIADEKINALVIESISSNFPSHGIIAEEGSTGTGSEECEWICDPIDGTIPFVLRFPMSVFSLAFYVNKKPIFGILFDPFRNILYHAFHGHKAYANDSVIQVKPGKLQIGDTVGLISFVKQSSEVFDCTHLSRVLNHRLIRSEEVHSLCYFSVSLASGFLKCAFTPSAFVWDRAASSIIVEAAGGVMADENGNPFDPFTTPKFLLISNKDTLPEMVQLARDYIVTS